MLSVKLQLLVMLLPRFPHSAATRLTDFFGLFHVAQTGGALRLSHPGAAVRGREPA